MTTVSAPVCEVCGRQCDPVPSPDPYPQAWTCHVDHAAVLADLETQACGKGLGVKRYGWVDGLGHHFDGWALHRLRNPFDEVAIELRTLADLRRAIEKAETLN